MIASLALVAEAVPVVFPVHPRTRARIETLGLDVADRIQLIDPQPYGRFLSLESAAMAVVTDSGGVQEETTALGVRCFTLRNNTERPVTVSHGTNIVLGLDPERLAAIPEYLELAHAPRHAAALGRRGRRSRRRRRRGTTRGRPGGRRL